MLVYFDFFNLVWEVIYIEANMQNVYQTYFSFTRFKKEMI